jgi:hypothetical protein
MIINRYLLLALLILLSGCSILGGREDTPDPPVPPSSQFEWTVDTLGAIGSSPTGVEILSENEIWLSGLYYRTPYDDQGNAARWDGQNWEIMDLPARNNVGDISIQSTRTILEQKSSLWFSTQFGSYINYENGTIRSEAFTPGDGRGSINELIAIDSTSFFMIGTNGTLTKVTTEPLSFQFIETNTQETIIAGFFANDTLKLVAEGPGGIYQIINVVENHAEFELEDTDDISNPIEGPFIDVWHDGSMWYYATNAGVYTKSNAGYTLFTEYYAHYLTGNTPNDILITSFFGSLVHWNGQAFNIVQNPLGTTHNGPLLPPADQRITVRGVSFKNNVVCILGRSSDTQQAVVWIGKRVKN